MQLEHYRMCHCLCSPTPHSHLDNETVEDTIRENKMGPSVHVAYN